MMKDKNTHKYDDIINLPHHVSKTRPPMPREKRAAQFSPFAALTGHEAAIKETARPTERQSELSEDRIALLDARLRALADKIDEHPEITVTYFQQDQKKDGGIYVTLVGTVKRMDHYRGVILLMDGREIPIKDIRDIV